MPRRLLAVLLAAGLSLTACAEGDPGTHPGAPVRAVAAFYPLAFALERVGGGRVSVEDLTEPGAEPHDLELTARQTGHVEDADLLVHLGGFQPAVDQVAAAAGDRAFDVADVVPLQPADSGLGDDAVGGRDPHLWLDPTLLARVGDALADRLSEVDPAGAAGYRAGAASLRRDLEQLDSSFRTGLAHCARTDLVVSHAAFGYLARRYGLHQVGISGLSPDAEPGAGRIAEAARYAKEHDVTTVWFERLVSPAVARTVAQEVGARAAVLDPVEGQPADGDYLTAMRGDLAALRTGLGCA